MANNNDKVISARELLPHEKRLVEDDFSHLSQQQLDRLAPTALNGQKLKSGLAKGEYLLLSDHIALNATMVRDVQVIKAIKNHSGWLTHRRAF